jgi:hypothetical protein
MSEVAKGILLSVENAEGEMEFVTADVIMPEPGSEDERLIVIPGTMKPVVLEALPPRARAGFALLAEQSEKAREAGIEEPVHSITDEMVGARMEQFKQRGE